MSAERRTPNIERRTSKERHFVREPVLIGAKEPHPVKYWLKECEAVSSDGDGVMGIYDVFEGLNGLEVNGWEVVGRI